MTTTTFQPIPYLAKELGISPNSIAAVLKLLEEGATVPFISRYRKEATGELDEVQVRTIQERHGYLTELEERRTAILASIEEQGKLTAELRAQILACDTKATLEDLYLPYKPKRRTRAMIARERGLEPLSERIRAQPTDGDPSIDAAAYVNAEKELPNVETVLSGARDIIAEQISEEATIRATLREAFSSQGKICSKVNAKSTSERSKFEHYYDFSEPVAKIPSHRYLAMCRGEREEILNVALDVDADPLIDWTTTHIGINRQSPYAEQLMLAATDAFRRLLSPSLESDVRKTLKLRSDEDAVEIFATNLRQLLLASPLGARTVIGIDPGLRTGCKCAVIDHTGAFIVNKTLYLCQGDDKEQAARRDLLALVKQYHPFAIAIGNGTASRETQAFVRSTLANAELKDIIVVEVNEAGASVYSASDVAREEFPDLDVTVRGAISIARRLQDPLAELVKIDPKSIGVGQYQHDVFQPLLQRKLDEVVESCVNQVGVELNTASAPLLSRVAGVGPALANKIVQHRQKNGNFSSRKQLLEVSGMGPRTFEQAAGFLRVRGGEHPLDASAVHPERYALVEKMAKDLGANPKELVGNESKVNQINYRAYVSDDVGEPTLRDIIAELQKPGRDPRASFEPPAFRDDVTKIEDLAEGMTFEGIVTNMTAFGVFVDIGVHQDGLVHISQLSEKFVTDPMKVVRVGEKLRVRVINVDIERKRISLSARMSEAKSQATPSQETHDDRQERTDHARSDAKSSSKPPFKKTSASSTRAPAKFSNNPFAERFKQK